MDSKEATIFNHLGNSIKTEDREISILVKYEEPLIVLLGNVLSDEECEKLILLSKDKMNRSKIGVSRVVNEIRTSSSMFFQERENDLIMKIENRISSIMNIPIEHGEGIQILNYTPGQEYKAHFDFFSSKEKVIKNNRISTIIIYLNNVESGGETVFPELNLSFSPKKGTAVYFEYFYNDKKKNEQTLHAGAPIVAGEKWVATQWMRRQKR
ncbi:2OG-Fe(II) oxygenase [Jeotgalibacillus proteolyticus]|uniref:2OG-Fe(II) oxygenase n=1 Tax=Jeotgalibacillus proteolyticus TaxID=2082395 RepID=A0A2S5GDT0_9BACL|nr:2OG-Fe(II) oxygenase [Jeotgalibacillus proteolyticus]PPA71149.1 2OG-Fe(II) oxygenase [Jeotgalibacillus proteolyticus]